MTRRTSRPAWVALLVLLAVQALDVAWAAPERLSAMLRSASCCAHHCATLESSACTRDCCPSTRQVDSGATWVSPPLGAERLSPAIALAPFPLIPVAASHAVYRPFMTLRAWKAPPSLLSPPLLL